MLYCPQKTVCSAEITSPSVYYEHITNLISQNIIRFIKEFLSGEAGDNITIHRQVLKLTERKKKEK